MTENKLNNELTLDQIPQGLLDELKEHFGKVTFALDSDINAETKSLKANYVETVNDEPIEMTALDSVTFTPKTFMAVPQQTFIVRINKNGSGVTVKRVLTSGLVAAVPNTA